MQKAPVPKTEPKRLEALKSLGVMDTGPEDRFDRITEQATKKLNVPIAVISLLDSDREWFKSCQGLNYKQADRAVSFCGHAMFSNLVFIVEDTLKDPRFSDNPQVVGAPYIRFYAGVALHERKSGQPVGVFCVKDTKPRQLNPEELSLILYLGNQAEEELNAKLEK